MQGRPLGVVHRDVSPQNIIVGIDGSSRLIDFGVAKASHRLTETKSGSVKGKYSYMAPEQARGQEVDRRTDIFAAGVVLHECLTDKRLFRGENELDTVRRIMELDIPVPSSIQPAIPAALDAVTLKALARPAEQRFQTAVEMAEAIEHAVSLASPREVAAYLERTCGKRLQERRDALREMIAGHVAPLAVELSRDPGESQSSRSVRISGLPAEGTDARIAVAGPPRERSRTALIAAVAIAAAAVGALAIVVANRSTTAQGPAVTATPTHTSTSTSTIASTIASTSASTSTSTNSDVVVELTAEAPIESVHVPGSKKIELAGNTARVSVDPWSAALKVEATLEGGKKVGAVLEPGTTSAKLAAPKKVGGTATTNVVNTNKPDLQGNPYGTP
jgi:serine/threonine-protein kinase